MNTHFWKGIVGKGFTSADFIDYVFQIKMGVWHPNFVVLHNTYMPKLSQWHSVPGEQRMKNLEVYYRDQQKWSGGPHLFVADDLIWVFTPLTMPGVHSPSWNQISWGVEMVGDYDTEPFTIQDNVIAALATLHKFGKLNPSLLKFHKEDPRTTHKECPGKNVVKADILQALNDKLIALQTVE